MPEYTFENMSDEDKEEFFSLLPHYDAKHQVSIFVDRDIALDYFAYSEDKVIREGVARRGYELDRLAQDPETSVRMAVMEQGYEPELFALDPDVEIRIALAVRGTANHLLVSDDVDVVRQRVAQNADYAKEPEIIDALSRDKSAMVREAVARRGYCLDELKHDEADRVRAAVAEVTDTPEEFIDDPSWRVRREVAERGVGLEEFAYDEAPPVRAVVASKGVMLDVLSHDGNTMVRNMAMRAGYALTLDPRDFLDDPDDFIRFDAHQLAYQSAIAENFVERFIQHVENGYAPATPQTPETKPRMVDGPNLGGDIKQGTEVAKNMTQPAPQRQRGPQTV